MQRILTERNRTDRTGCPYSGYPQKRYSDEIEKHARLQLLKAWTPSSGNYLEASMPSGVQKIIPSRLLILAWVITWITAVPLFHTHLPDITYGPASLQGGLAHTVFSPDLPGEFSCPHDHFAHVSSRVFNSPELGFVLSTEDSKSRKVGERSVLGVLCCFPNRPFPTNSAIESRATHRRLLLLSASQGPRAPPSVVSL